MNKIISIIIPVYNCSQYIKRCIESIVHQDTACNSCELIVIDDGSTDNSLPIIKNLKKQYPFIKLIESNHRGSSAARNLGLKEAVGDYLFFIDADDWISPSALSYLTSSIASHPSHIILFGIEKVYAWGKTKRLNYHLPKISCELTVENYINRYTILSSACQGIYSRELLIENKIQFPEGLLCEDDDFVIKLFATANSIYFCNKTLYYYYQRTDSTSNFANIEHNTKLVFDKLVIFENLIPYIEQLDEARKTGLKNKLQYLALDIIRLSIRKPLDSNQINEILARLTKTGYYPLKTSRYKTRQKPFCLVLSKPYLIRLCASSIFFRGFF